MSDETCWLCEEPAVQQWHARLSAPDDPDWLDVAMGREERAPGSGIKLYATACAAHDDAVSEAFMDRFGSVGGYRLASRPGEDCPDTFHEGERGEAYVVDAAGPWSVAGFRCPTCGFETVNFTPGADRTDPAYLKARAILDKWLPAALATGGS